MTQVFDRDVCETATALAFIQTSSWVFFFLQHTVKGLIKEKGLCVVPRDLKWLHGERGGGRKEI